MPFQFRKEAIEEDLNTNFPSQGQGNPPLYYSLSEVVVPTYSINSVAEGSGLPEILQTAWDFGTGSASVNNTTTTIINTTGFWKIDLTAGFNNAATAQANVKITDGLTSKTVYRADNFAVTGNTNIITDNSFVVFVRSGDSVTCQSSGTSCSIAIWYRQIADVNGNLVNPLGYSAA